MIERYENEIIFLANEALSKFLSTMYRGINWSISLEKKTRGLIAAQKNGFSVDQI